MVGRWGIRPPSPGFSSGASARRWILRLSLVAIATSALALPRVLTAAAPAKPTGFTVVGGNMKATLTWEDPLDSTIDRWQYKQGTADWTTITGSTASTTSHEIGSLTNGTQYSFRIRAGSLTDGFGTASDSITVRALAKPATPTGFSATAGDQQVTLAWVSINETYSDWQYRQDSAAWTDIEDSHGYTTSHTVTDLTNGTEYAFKIRAINANEPGESSEVKRATPKPKPAKPAGVEAMPGHEQVTLTWTDPLDMTITGWEVSYGSTSWVKISDSTATTTSHTVTGLINGDSYSFVLRAVNASGAGPSSDTVTATPLAVPAKPPGFAALARDMGVSLQWSHANNSSITGWEYQQNSAANWTTIPGGTANTTFYTVTGLTNRTKYEFKLRAVNASGKGEPSELWSVTPKRVPNQPTGVTAKAGNAEVTLSWEDLNNKTVTHFAVKSALAEEAEEAHHYGSAPLG